MYSLPALLKSLWRTGESARIFLSPPHMNGEELGLIYEAFATNYIAPVGPMIDEFENAFCNKVGLPYATALSSGTAAMHLALRNLGVGPGDTVMASTLTFIGSVSPILFQGATPIFIDSDRVSWNMDSTLLEQALDECSKNGTLPRAVVPTDLYGQCADYGRIFPICERYGVPVVVDAAEALGAKYLTQRHRDAKEDQNEVLTTDTHRHTQTFFPADPAEEKRASLGRKKQENWVDAGVGAKAAIYSFNGNKILTSSGGGMLASEDEDFIEKARYLSQQARDPLPHYEHTEIGYNYRMSNILAAIGLGQLQVLEDRVQRKREIFDTYMKALGDLPGIEFMPEAPYSRSSRWLTVVLITPEEFGADREKVRLVLEEENIESRPVWKPMHMQPVFDCLPAQGARRKAKGVKREPFDPFDKLRTGRLRTGRLHSAELMTKSRTGREKKRHEAQVIGGEVAEDLFNRGLCLPSGTAMTDADLDRVIEVIRRSRKK